MFSTVPHEHHRLLNPFFSKRAIVQLEPMINQNVDRAIAQIRQAKVTGSVVNLSNLYMAFTGDVISDYTFGSTLGLLDNEQLQNDWRAVWLSMSGTSLAVKQLPIIGKILRVMPPAITQLMDKRFRLITSLITVRRHIQNQVWDDRTFQSAVIRFARSK
jgi:cytochrome P450